MLGPLFAAALATATPASGGEPLSHWGAIRLRTWRGRTLDRAVDVELKQAGERQGSYLIAEKTESLRGGPASRTRADSRRCPPLAALPNTVAELGPLALGRQTPLVEPDPERPGWSVVHVAMDGPRFTVEAPLTFADRSNGKLSLTAGSGALGAWVNRTLSSLAVCWAAE